MRREEEIRNAVKKHYGEIAERRGGSCCAPSCCGAPATQQTISTDAARLGYSRDDLLSAPRESNMGFGCGNPIAVASLRPGEVVVDLGSGAGFDCFLAAKKVGPQGKVIGVDMTEEMLERARRSAAAGGYANVEFRRGKIEQLPLDDRTADVVISNCVINLSPEKAKAFRETYRVLKPGGRLAVSDIVANAPLPDEIRNDLDLHSCCIGGAATVDEVRAMLQEAGFVDIRIDLKEQSRAFIKDWVPGSGAEQYVVSAEIHATRPAP
jgi:arsenite methyltransferase